MKVVCPSCRSQIPAGNLNAGTDVAACARCGEVFSLSAIVGGGADLADFDVASPPRGAWFQESLDGWTLGATTRSAGALFLVPFMCVWSGISLGGIYGTQIAHGEFNLGMSLFGIPFVLGTLLFGSIAVMSVCGKVTVSVDRHMGRIFTGVGPIGWTRCFDWQDVARVEEDRLGYRNSGRGGFVVSMVGKTRLKFGSMLTDSRRYYLLQSLRKLLATRPA